MADCTGKFRVVRVIDEKTNRPRTWGIMYGESRRYLIPPKGTPPLSEKLARRIARDFNQENK